jgi:hypothetical protein
LPFALGVEKAALSIHNAPNASFNAPNSLPHTRRGKPGGAFKLGASNADQKVRLPSGPAAAFAFAGLSWQALFAYSPICFLRKKAVFFIQTTGFIAHGTGFGACGNVTAGAAKY